MAISKVMSTNVVTIEMDDSLKEVRNIFEHTSFHHLLVVNSGKLVGVISDRDLLKSLSPHLETLAETTKDLATLNKKVHQIMSRELVILPPDASLYDAIDIFNNNKISCIPVVDETNIPVGIVSWRDILRLIKKDTENKK